MGSEFAHAQKGSTASREYLSEKCLQIFGSGLHEEQLSFDSKPANRYLYFAIVKDLETENSFLFLSFVSTEKDLQQTQILRFQF